jgi:RNA polymerase sigma-70 factor (ECF subfamily)
MPATSESTAELLGLCRQGSNTARDQLMRRFLPILRNWARGRLPQHARENAATDDLVQLTLVRALSHLDDFVPEREGAFLAFLRAIFLNQLRDEMRRTVRAPNRATVDDIDVLAGTDSPLESAVGQQALEAYEAALAELPAVDREAVLMRLEFGYEYAEIAVDLGLPSANAARMRISRAVEQLAGIIDVEQLRT